MLEGTRPPKTLKAYKVNSKNSTQKGNITKLGITENSIKLSISTRCFKISLHYYALKCTRTNTQSTETNDSN